MLRHAKSVLLEAVLVVIITFGLLLALAVPNDAVLWRRWLDSSLVYILVKNTANSLLRAQVSSPSRTIDHLLTIGVAFIGVLLEVTTLFVLKTVW